MKENLKPRCNVCSGTIGPIIKKPNGDTIEIWFKCLYCESMGDNYDVLIQVIDDHSTI